MEFITGFVNVFNQIKDGIFDVISIIWKLPSFILNSLNILPSDLRIPFTLVISIIVILLIYRFIR